MKIALIECSRYDVETMLGLNLAPPFSGPIQPISPTATPRNNGDTSTADENDLFVTNLNSARIPARVGPLPGRLGVDEGGCSTSGNVAYDSPSRTSQNSSDDDLFRDIDFDGQQGQ